MFDPSHRTGLGPAIAALIATGCADSAVRDREVPSPASDLLTVEERAWLDEHSRSIRIGPDPNFPPFEFFGDDGEYAGIAADYVRLIEGRLGIEFEVVRLPDWEAVVDGYENRRIDVVGAMTRTAPRERFMSFTEPYLEVPTVIVTRTDEKRTLQLHDLSGMKVLVLKGYASEQYLKENYSDLEARPVPDIEIGLRMVSNGEADAIVVHLAVYAYVANRIGIENLHVAGNTNHLVRLAFASRNDWPVLGRILEKTLATITPEERKAIYNRWVRIGPPSFFQSPRFLMLVAAAAASILLAVLLVFAWNRMLRRRVDERTRELRDVRNYLSDLFNAMPSVLVAVDQDRRVTRWNRAAESLTGIPRDAAVGRPFVEVLPFLGGLSDRVTAAVSAPEPGAAANASPEHVVHGDRFFDVTVFPMRRERNRGAVIRLDDVTEVAVKEQQLRRAQRMEILGSLAGGLAHDFNTYLAAITGGLSLLETRFAALDPHSRETLRSHTEVIADAARQASRLVRQLLELGRRREVKSARVDLNEVVRGTTDMLRTSLDPSVDLSVETSPETAVVRGDASQIAQVLLNLCLNAAHAMTTMRGAGETRGGVLAIRVGRAERGSTAYHVLSVQDTGIGMDEATIGRIFDPFFSTKADGTGLGLAMAYKIVDQHGGFIEVHSTPGEGSTFDVFLPASAP